jgi:hypothetical protein
MTLERDEHGHPKDIGEVTIEEVQQRTGWALFTGCDGEVAHFHAFFACKADAERYIEHCQKDTEGDEYMCDPGLAPAAVIDGHIVAANHYDDELGAGVMVRASGVYGEDAERLCKEAAPVSSATPKEKQ